MSWDAASPPPIFEGEDELALKLEYARLIFGRDDRIRTAGHEIFPGPENYGRAMQVAVWRHDPIVRNELERLGRGDGASETLPTEAEYKAHLWRMAQTETDPKLRFQYAELYGKTENIVPTGSGANINIANDNSTNNTIVVPALPATPEEIEVAALRTERRQARLMEHARSRPTKLA